MAQHNSKLTEETWAAAIELAGKGCTNKVIARALGIHEDTFQDWIRKGRQGQNEPFPWEDFYTDLEKARGVLAAQMSERVIEAANSGLPQTWQAAMTFLERRYPEEWGRRDKTIIEGGENALPQINILVLNDPNARAAHRDLLRSVSDAGSGIAIGPGVGGELEDGDRREAVLDVVESPAR